MPIAVIGLTPMIRIRIGVISVPPPTPVMPDQDADAEPEAHYDWIDMQRSDPQVTGVRLRASLPGR